MIQHDKKPTNYPRAEIMRMAESAIQQYGGPSKARVYFKFTCAHCGERCTFSEPNKLYEEGECGSCGKTTTVNDAGFMLALTDDDGSFAAGKWRS